MTTPRISPDAHRLALEDRDRWRTMYADLLEKYHALRLVGATPARDLKPAAVRQPPPDPMDQALGEAEAAHVEQMAQAFHVTEGVSLERAREEATRIAQQMRQTFGADGA